MAVRVLLQNVKPTMRLARPVLDAEGRLVAGAGTYLQDGVVRVLRTMAVQSVLVVEAGQLATWEQLHPLPDELAALDRRLGPAGRTGPLGELRTAIVRHLTARAARLAEEEARWRALDGEEPSR